MISQLKDIFARQVLSKARIRLLRHCGLMTHAKHSLIRNHPPNVQTEHLPRNNNSHHAFPLRTQTFIAKRFLLARLNSRVYRPIYKLLSQKYDKTCSVFLNRSNYSIYPTFWASIYHFRFLQPYWINKNCHFIDVLTWLSHYMHILINRRSNAII